MKNFLTPHDIANQIRMMRPLHSGAVVIVEGDSDARVYRRFVDDTCCRVIPAHGKSNVLSALSMLEENNFRGVLAIIDSDFWRLDGTKPESLNILMTDTHDLETMIVFSRAFDTVLDEFGSAGRIHRLGGDVREVLLRVAMPIGFFRWISSSKQDNLSLRFKDISFIVVIDTRNKTMKTNIDTLLNEVKKHSRNAPFDEQEIKNRIKKLLRGKGCDPWHVCRGHDMIHILTIGLRDVFGNRHAKSITYEQIDRIMRIAFGYREFSRTELFVSIGLWEKTNPDFKVLGN